MPDQTHEKCKKTFMFINIQKHKLHNSILSWDIMSTFNFYFKFLLILSTFGMSLHTHQDDSINLQITDAHLQFHS